MRQSLLLRLAIVSLSYCTTAVAQERAPMWTRGAHEFAVTSVDLSNDGRVVATGGGDNLVRVWERATGRLLETYRGHPGSVRGVAFSPDRSRLASISGDAGTSQCRIMLWDRTSGRGLVLPMQWDAFDLTDVEFSPDGSMLAVASGATIQLYSIPDGRPLGTLLEYSSGARHLSFSPDGERIAAAHPETMAFAVWSVDDRDTLYVNRVGRAVFAMDFADDGRTLAVTSGDYRSGVLSIHDADHGGMLDSLSIGQAPRDRVAFRANNRQILYRTESEISIVDLVTRTTVDSLPMSEGQAIDVENASGAVIGASSNGYFEWIPQSGMPPRRSEVFAFDVGTIPFSPDGDRIAVRSTSSLKILDAATGEEVRSVAASADLASFTSGGDSLITFLAGSYEPLFARRSTITGGIDSSLKIPGYRSSYHSTMAGAISPDGRLAAIAETFGGGSCAPGLRSHATVYEMHAPHRSWRLDSAGRKWLLVDRLEFSSDGEYIVGSGTDSVLWVWRAETGALIASRALGVRVTAFEISPDATRIAVGTDRGRVLVVTTTDLADVRTINAHSSTVTSLVFSSDGKVLISGGVDRKVRMWHFPNGSNARTISYPAAITSLSLSPTMDVLLVTGDDATIAAYDTRELREMSAGLAMPSASVDLSSMTIVPNPTRGAVRLLTSQPARLAHVTVTDVMGRAVYQYHGDIDQSVLLNTEALAAGSYFCRISVDGGSRTIRFTVVE